MATVLGRNRQLSPTLPRRRPQNRPRVSGEQQLCAAPAPRSSRAEQAGGEGRRELQGSPGKRCADLQRESSNWEGTGLRCLSDPETVTENTNARLTHMPHTGDSDSKGHFNIQNFLALAFAEQDVRERVRAAPVCAVRRLSQGDRGQCRSWPSTASHDGSDSQRYRLAKLGSSSYDSPSSFWVQIACTFGL